MERREINPTEWLSGFNAFMAQAGDLVPIFAGDGCKPVSTLLGVAALFEPEIMVELEATAVA